MMARTLLLDCYTDEASGLGVPPYLGTYSRYIAGMLDSEGKAYDYITIDDLRKAVFYDDHIKPVKEKDKTNIRVYNTTRESVRSMLHDAEEIIVILGVHVPGKYLSAVPGTFNEVAKLLQGVKAKKILTGPGIFGSRLEGGKFFEKQQDIFAETFNSNFPFSRIRDYAIRGASILRQIPDERILEIETGRGCNIGRCSFCTEPLKNAFLNRDMEDVLAEMLALYENGARHFRLGKQADFYSIDRPVELLKSIREKMPDIRTLHIDNVNPNFVIRDKEREITEALVRYCSSGNVAAFGVESFDPVVVRENTLNTAPAMAMKAIGIINEFGQKRGEDGMPRFLPGINIIFGLCEESKSTHEKNMEALQRIMDNSWMLRRINIRQAAILPNTMLEKKCGNKFLRKNKKYYWSWRNDIRQKIDFPMLKRIVPEGTILKGVRMEVYDGKHTFGRQMGTYPLIVGINKRVELKKYYDVRITGHMLRSVTGEIVQKSF